MAGHHYCGHRDCRVSWSLGIILAGHLHKRESSGYLNCHHQSSCAEHHDRRASSLKGFVVTGQHHRMVLWVCWHCHHWVMSFQGIFVAEHSHGRTLLLWSSSSQGIIMGMASSSKWIIVLSELSLAVIMRKVSSSQDITIAVHRHYRGSYNCGQHHCMMLWDCRHQDIVIAGLNQSVLIVIAGNHHHMSLQFYRHCHYQATAPQGVVIVAHRHRRALSL